MKTTVGVCLMMSGVWVILAAPDISGATLFGAFLYLAGLWVAQRVQASRQWRRSLPRDSTARAVETQAEDMADGPTVVEWTCWTDRCGRTTVTRSVRRG